MRMPISSKQLNRNPRPTLSRMRTEGNLMKWIVRILLAASLLLITACAQVRRDSQQNHVSIVGSGALTSRMHSLAEFDTLEAGLSYDLSIRQGDDFSVVLIADDNLVEYLTVEQTGGTLRFDLKPGYAYNLSNVTMRAEVTLPELAGLVLSGASHAALEDFRALGAFEAALTGSSSLVGRLEAGTVSLDTQGNSTVRLTGSGRDLRLQGCGNSLSDLSGFDAENAVLELSCVSTAIVHVDGRLDVDASQNSQVYFLGQPGSSEIKVYEQASAQPKR